MRSCWEQSIETLSRSGAHRVKHERVQSDGGVCSLFTSRSHMLLFTFYLIEIYPVEQGKLHTRATILSTQFAL